MTAHVLEMSWLLFLLYAETHYAFKGIYSRLKKKEPEIIADAPHRLEPGSPLPILILIKDADKYPVVLDGVNVHLNGKKSVSFDFHGYPVREAFWSKVIEINRTASLTGPCHVQVEIEVRINGKKRRIQNDNYAATSHAPLDVFFAEHPLPKCEGWTFGEFHCHTSYTSDQVEFGAPLEPSVKLAKALGLNFFCATDHSYDLDDMPDNYLQNDPDLEKWRELLKEIDHLNRDDPEFVVVPGEEVSAGNSKNRNIHFLILNHPDFLPGHGDSAEKWFRTRPNLSIAEVLHKISPDAVAFAAHPGVKPPFLEWLLVRRGKWSYRDCRHPGLHGLQIWNGTENGFFEGKQLWRTLLLQGRRIFISGGNDAHGNFNRFRQIGLPFFTMRESHEHLFGHVRTGVFLDAPFSLSALLDGFKKGRMIVTNGPFLQLKIYGTGDKVAFCGDTLKSDTMKLNVVCHSSPEFGPLRKLDLFYGDFGKQGETPLKTTTDFTKPYSHQEEIVLTESLRAGYIRGELFSGSEARSFQCLTNPIWVKTLV
ncbi:MAG: CehA/McbA family metallohydrolase [bacterium]